MYVYFGYFGLFTYFYFYYLIKKTKLFVLMFKESFKYYKAKWPVPEFLNVIDLDQCTNDSAAIISIPLSLNTDCLPLGVKPIRTWKCYQFKNKPGLIFIKNPFTPKGQRYWLSRCIQDYPKTPNVVNLSSETFKKEIIDNWWDSLQKCTDSNFSKKLKIAMRWTTLGYHHDWDTKIYSEEMKHTFPKDLAELSLFFANALGFKHYSAEAAIVNYYPIGTTLAGHTDHSESDLAAPLFSFSFGQTAIFLLGGQTKEEEPLAMFLKSGDIVVMSKESRLCYHAVPRVMKSEVQIWNEMDNDEDVNLCNDSNDGPDCKKAKTSELAIDQNFSMDIDIWNKCSRDEFWKPFKTYLEDSRININVRQVLKEGQNTL